MYLVYSTEELIRAGSLKARQRQISIVCPCLCERCFCQDKFPLFAHVYVKDVSVYKEMQQKDQGTSVSQISL